MKTSDSGRKFIEQFEGLILRAYDDYNDRIVPVGGSVRGTLTIGYGHTNAAGPPAVHVGQAITGPEADSILASDLAKVETEVTRLVNGPLNQNQFDALVSFEFNTGALEHSSALKYLNQQQFEQAWDVLMQYIHASGRVLPGLVRRRTAEKALFFTAPKFTTTVPVVQVGFWQALFNLFRRN